MTSSSSDWFSEDPASTEGRVLMCWRLGLQHRNCKGDAIQSLNRLSQFFIKTDVQHQFLAFHHEEPIGTRIRITWD